MRRLAGRQFTTSCQFFVGAVVRVQVHRPLRICVHGPQYCLRSLVCSKVLTHLGASSYVGLLLICRPVVAPFVSARFPESTETHLPTPGLSNPSLRPSSVLFSVQPPSPGPPLLLFREY